MMLAQLGERSCITGMNRAKKFLGLTLELLEVWSNG